MAYASRLYPRAEPRGFTLQRIKVTHHIQFTHKNMQKHHLILQKK